MIIEPLKLEHTASSVACSAVGRSKGLGFSNAFMKFLARK